MGDISSVYISKSEKKTSCFCFFPGDVGYRRRKYCFFIDHAYRPHLVMPRVVSTAHARAQYSVLIYLQKIHGARKSMQSVGEAAGSPV